MATTVDPTLTVVSKDDLGRARVRLTGGTLADGWTVRPGQDAWCEIVVRLDDGFVGSFGGEVWPGAWPAVFDIGPATRDGASVRMRPEWLDRVRSAPTTSTAQLSDDDFRVLELFIDRIAADNRLMFTDGRTLFLGADESKPIARNDGRWIRLVATEDPGVLRVQAGLAGMRDAKRWIRR